MNRKCFLNLKVFLVLVMIFSLLMGQFSGYGEVKAKTYRITSAEASTLCSFAIGEDGSLWGWGTNESCQLGDGSMLDKKLPIKILEDVKKVATGGEHCLAIKNDGSLWGWGLNDRGQLGDDTNYLIETPKKILEGVTDIAVGGGFSLAVKKDGSLWAWGANYSGQLGDGTAENKSKPVKIMEDVSRIYAGYGHSLAVKKDNTLWTWGVGEYGQLGDGGKTNKNKPAKILDGVTSAAAGYNNSFIIKEDGSLWACGYNRNGELGDGTTSNRNTFAKVLDGVKIVEAGGYHTLAVKEDKSLWAWGQNSLGELGDGTTTDQHAPIKVMDSIKQIAAGGSYSLIIKEDGSLWGWGNNYRFQLGDGTDNSTKTPILLNNFSAAEEEKAVTLDKKSITIKIGAYQYLTSSASPADIIDKNVTWTTSDPLVATVDMYGKVTGVRKGKAIITVSTVLGKKKVTCTVTVLNSKTKSSFNEEAAEAAAKKAVEKYETAPFHTDKELTASESLKEAAIIAVKSVKNPVIKAVFINRIVKQAEAITEAKINTPVMDQVDDYNYSSEIDTANPYTQHDFYVVLSPAFGDLPSLTAGQTGNGSRSVISDINGMNTVEFRFDQDEEGNYYFEYRNNRYSYPYMYYKAEKFTPTRDGRITLYVKGYNDILAGDIVGANVLIFNYTDVNVDIYVDDITKEQTERLQIDSRVGNVKIYWEENAE